MGLPYRQAAKVHAKLTESMESARIHNKCIFERNRRDQSEVRDETATKSAREESAHAKLDSFQSGADKLRGYHERCDGGVGSFRERADVSGL